MRGEKSDPAEYYAERFAAKEAAFKAVAHFLPGEWLDFAMIETRSHADRTPYIEAGENLQIQALLESAHIDRLHVSLTTERDFATAIVLAERMDA